MIKQSVPIRQTIRAHRFVLIDGHAILHRAFHAFPQTLTTRKGELVNAVYGFTRMLFAVIEDLQPEYLAVAFDLPKPTFRHKEFLGYQAQRPRTDEALSGQIERVWEVVRALKLPIYTAEGFEADDVIGSLAAQATGRSKIKDPTKEAGSQKSKTKIKNPKIDEIVIVTGDRDIMQLVDDRVKVYAPQKGFSQAKLFGPKEVEEHLGVAPEKIVDYKALVGDPSDNYPGVTGVGPKTAVKLLGEYGNLAGVYEAIGVELSRKGDKEKQRGQERQKEKNHGGYRSPVIKRKSGIKKSSSESTEINERTRDKLVAGRESALLSQKLARIVDNAPVKLDLKKCRLRDYDSEAVRELFEELEFKSLLKRLPGSETESGKREEGKKKAGEQMKLL